MTLEQIAKAYGVCVQRVWQIETDAMRKILRSVEGHILSEYAGDTERAKAVIIKELVRFWTTKPKTRKKRPAVR